MNYEFSDEAKAWSDKMFPCEKPCDSYGVCSNCCEKSVFQAGYNFASKAAISKIAELEGDNKALREINGHWAQEKQREFAESKALISRQSKAIELLKMQRDSFVTMPNDYYEDYEHIEIMNNAIDLILNHSPQESEI